MHIMNKIREGFIDPLDLYKKENIRITLVWHNNILLLNLSETGGLLRHIREFWYPFTWQEDSSPCSSGDTVHPCRWTSCRSYSQPGWSGCWDRISGSAGATLSCSAPGRPRGQCHSTWAQRQPGHRRTSGPKIFSISKSRLNHYGLYLVMVSECVP